MIIIGKTEIDETEIRHKSITNKATIPLTEIRDVKIKDPGLISLGTITVIPYYNKLIQITFKKQEKDFAYEVYNYLKSFAQKNKAPINELLKDPTLQSFQCTIHEEKQSTTTEKHTTMENAEVKIFDDRISIEKIGMFSNMDRGKKNVMFKDITSIDLDIGIVNSYVVVTMAGSPGITIQNINKAQLEKFYDVLLYKYDNFVNSKNNHTTNTSNVSDTEELLKWHELKEKGVITEEEFEAKKKMILGL